MSHISKRRSHCMAKPSLNDALLTTGTVVWRSAACTSFNAFLSASFSTVRHKESLRQKIFIVAS
jgi:hypothetical protein